MPKPNKPRRSADDAPLTAKELKTARWSNKAPPGLIAALKKSRGRPIGRHKESVHLSLDADLVQAMRDSGKGWQTRANALLRKGLKLSARSESLHGHI